MSAAKLLWFICKNILIFENILVNYISIHQYLSCKCKVKNLEHRIIALEEVTLPELGIRVFTSIFLEKEYYSLKIINK